MQLPGTRQLTNRKEGTEVTVAIDSCLLPCLLLCSRQWQLSFPMSSLALHSDHSCYWRALANRGVDIPGISQNGVLILGILGPCDFLSRWITLRKGTGLAWHKPADSHKSPGRGGSRWESSLLAVAPVVCTKHPVPGPRCVQVPNCQRCTKIWRVREELQNHEHWGRC